MRLWLKSLCAAALLFSAPAQAAAPPLPAHSLTSEDVDGWLDGYMTSALKAGGVAGAVVVVVKDGQVISDKGYGYADMAARRPVDPARTLFRVGSVTKLFTWTAVMQQVELGRIDLDADINRYLDFKMPPYAGRPITMRDLMTHTAGFEEARTGLVTFDPKKVVPLGQALARWTPRRVYAAGTTPAYSNYGAALAGYIVERVSGESYDAYVERHILSPLAMDHTTTLQPLPAAWRAQASLGYNERSGAPGPMELIVWKPAGSLTSTGQDMGRFMLAHLQDGELDGQRILAPATAQQMRDQTRSLLPPLNSSALGFYENSQGGLRIVGHAGDTGLFHSLLLLAPSQHVGLFFSFNSVGQQGAVYRMRDQLAAAFFDRYFPQGEPAAPTVSAEVARAHAAMFAPAYFSSRASHSSFLAFTRLFSTVKVKRNADGTISAAPFTTASGALKRYREITPFVWREVGGHDRLAAIVEHGRITRFSTDVYAAHMVLQAVPGAYSPAFVVPGGIVALLIVLATALSWPVSALLRRRFGAVETRNALRLKALFVLRVMALVVVAAAAGWAVVFSKSLQPGGVYFLADDKGLIFLAEVLSMVALPGALLASLFNLAMALKAKATWSDLLLGVAVSLACAMLLYTALAYNLLMLNARF